ncbi:MAG: ATP-binding protein [Pseudomonadota bacterium]|nr:ATP-binding protein [Pseudomonadota bacterium]
MTIPRESRQKLERLLRSFPVVALLGPRQVGKTTLALNIEELWPSATTYLDLELDSDLAKLDEPELYLRRLGGQLVIIDEIQRRPNLFPLLRSLVDQRIREGESYGQFFILGSASRDLLRQSSESLAGRIAYKELSPFSFTELAAHERKFDSDRLWLRGGFPGSYLAGDDRASWEWRSNFISTYLERDIPQLGPRLPAERMRRLWSMLALSQGAQLNLSRLAGSLGVSGHTVRHYLDVLTDLYMVRQLQPWAGNSRKRLVKSPKIYVRDSGLVHRLANIPDFETLAGHPIRGESWEGYVVENILNQLPDTWIANYYRTSAQAEIDLVLEAAGGEVIAIEIKRTLSPRPGKGFRLAAEDVQASRRFYVIPTTDRFPIGADTEAIGLADLIRELRAVSCKAPAQATKADH